MGKNLIFFLLFVCTAGHLRAEYRAYLIEVYDSMAQVRWDLETAFSPDKYILTHGGDDRISIALKATWHCYGDTSNYRRICLMPAPILPAFGLGDTVQVALDQHVTHSWQGVVEVALWREDLRSNVYGIRFEDKRRLYARYFEHDLKLVARAHEGAVAPEEEISTPAPEPNEAL